MLKTEELLDLSCTIAADLFKDKEYPWEALEELRAFVLSLGAGLSEDEYLHPEEGVWIAKDAKISPTACITAPCIIDHGAEIRHCAFIRGSAIVGKNAVVGNSVELKNALLFDGVQVPHYNYVGDSILGHKAHMGAGAVTSNVKADRSPVSVHGNEGDIETGRRKFGAILGDYAEIGCNSVLNPGSIVCRRSNVYPLSSLRGVVPENSIYKAKGNIVKKY